MNIWVLVPFYTFLAIGLLLTAAGLFGNAVIFCVIVVYALLSEFNPIGLKELLIIGALYGLGELLEYVFTLMGVKWLGASSAAGWLAIVGTIIGAMIGGSLFFVFGVIAGGFIGALLAALLTELAVKKNFGLALRAGIGAVLGKAGSIVVKLILAIIMVLYVTKIIYNGAGIPRPIKRGEDESAFNSSRNT